VPSSLRKSLKIRNPNIEIRNKQPKPEKSKTLTPNEPVWTIVFFDHLNLFRISDFELRICSSFYYLRALAPLREESSFVLFVSFVVNVSFSFFAAPSLAGWLIIG
jgi:hypothetical protein